MTNGNEEARIKEIFEDAMKRIEPEILEDTMNSIEDFLGKSQIAKIGVELSLDNSAEFLRKYISFCEQKLSRLCDKYSRGRLLYWLSIYEEVGMQPLRFEMDKAIQGGRAVKNAIIREDIAFKSDLYLTAKLVALKFGSDTGWLQRLRGKLLKRESAEIFGNPNQELDLKKLIFWSNQHIGAQYAYRTMQRASLNDRGVRLIFDPRMYILYPFIFCMGNKDDWSRADDNMHFYFQRTIAEVHNPFHFKFDILQSYRPYTIPLYSHIAQKVGYFDLLKSYEYYRLIRGAIEEKFGHRLEEMYAFLSALGERLESFIKHVQSLPRHEFVGMYFITKRELLEYLSERVEDHYNMLVKMMRIKRKTNRYNWRRMVQLLLNRFTMKAKDLKNLNLWTARPLLPLQEIEMNIISCDLSGILHEYLMAIFWEAEVGTDEPDRDIKGPHFEEYLNQLISNYCELTFLGARKKVKDARTGRQVTDIDLCYKLGNFLIVIECKARTVNPKFLQGDAKVTGHRWNDICDWVNNIDRVCKGLSQGSLRTPVLSEAIKLGATHIVPIVCVLSPQYLLDYGDKMVLMKSGYARKYIPTPRVCTPIELIFFIRNINQDELMKKLYVTEIRVK